MKYVTVSKIKDSIKNIKRSGDKGITIPNKLTFILSSNLSKGLGSILSLIILINLIINTFFTPWAHYLKI